MSIDLDKICLPLWNRKDILSVMTETATTPLTEHCFKDKNSLTYHGETTKRVLHCKQNKQVRVNLTDFYDALLAARGIPGPEEPKGRGHERIRLVFTKNVRLLLVPHTAMGLKPGDEFEIKAGLNTFTNSAR